MRAKDKIKYLAAVEQSSGTFTVDVMPEISSKVLRKL
jgi:UDPglucose--hexose-1-phosphate uridylyltransferase